MAKYKVAIDAGHGSNTAGKRTPDGHKEHWINVKVAYYCEKYLKSRGVDVFRCAWDDTNAKDDADVSLTQRQKLIKAAKCDIALSMHANAHGSGSKFTSAEGVETLVHITASKRGDSTKLANAIQKQLIKGTKQKNRGVKQQELAMCNCPAMGVKAAALMEIGFMTNKHEAELMKTAAFCKEQGEDIARGVLAYLGVKDVKKEEKAETTFKPYAVNITANTLNIRKSASATSEIVGVITGDKKLIAKNPEYYFPKTAYTIIEEKQNGATKWGRLKSKLGYISLKYTEKA